MKTIDRTTELCDNRSGFTRVVALFAVVCECVCSAALPVLSGHRHRRSADTGGSTESYSREAKVIPSAKSFDASDKLTLKISRLCSQLNEKLITRSLRYRSLRRLYNWVTWVLGTNALSTHSKWSQVTLTSIWSQCSETLLFESQSQVNSSLT